MSDVIQLLRSGGGERLGHQVCVVAAIAASIVLLRGPVLAQAATPTATPMACRGIERLKLTWKASTQQGKIFMRLNQCDPPLGCDGGATPLITAPITLLLEDMGGQRVTGVLPVMDFAKYDFCPGGHETFALNLGRLRYVFGSEGITGVVLKTTLLINDPPLFTGPVRFSLVDSGGYALGTVLPDCTVRDTGALVQVRCADTTRYGEPASTPQPPPTSNVLPTRTSIPTRTIVPTRTPIS